MVQSGQQLSQFCNVLILAKQAEGITLPRAVWLTRQATKFSGINPAVHYNGSKLKVVFPGGVGGRDVACIFENNT